MMKRKYTTCLWFDGNAEEAMKFYVSVFKGAKLGAITHYPKGSQESPAHQPDGSVLTVTADLGDLEIVGLNGGPMFKFSEATSISINCEDQAEIDRLTEALVKDGGQQSDCGWVKDKFGFSWQVNSKELNEMWLSKDGEAVARTQAAMMKMKKLDVAALKKAFKGE